MANPRGNVNGPFYPLGKFTVAVVGTTIPLNTNVPITDQSGTPTGGIAPQSSKGTPSPLKVTEIKIMTPTTNAGNVFLIFKGPAGADTAAGNSGAGVLLVIQPGQERTLQCSQTANGFTLDQFVLDADAANQVCWITCVIA